MTTDDQGKAPFVDAADAVLLLVDCQPGLSLASGSRPHQTLVNNVTALARTANVFDVPIVATTSARDRFSGPIFSQLAEFVTTPVLERHVLNAYDDDSVRGALAATGRSQIIIAGLLTEVCVAFPALSLRAKSSEVFIVADSCAGISEETHQLAIDRMIAAGVTTLSWIQLLLEWQKDWTFHATYQGATSILFDHGGAYGLALLHAHAMLTSPASTPTNS
jgi:nicotinamidase-related amidase